MQLKNSLKCIVKSSPGKGWGVFATEDIYEGEIIEICSLVSISLEKDIDNLKDYRFEYKIEGKETELVIPSGLGMIYNHSDNNNAAWRNHPRYKAFVFHAVKDIKAGEEICTYYGGDRYWNERPYINKI